MKRLRIRATLAAGAAVCVRLRKRADGVAQLFNADNGGSLLAPK